MKNIYAILPLGLAAALCVASCSPIGAAAGAGATLGIASAQEGGISSAANDMRIKALISEKWFAYKVETFRKLNLTVDQGRVLITGIVQNPDDRVEAVRLAWQVNGVKQVINEIRVSSSEGLKGYIKDTWITTRLRTAMTFDRNIQAINYSIDTVDGVVYLMGVAISQQDLNNTVALARTIPGVKQVVTYVKPMGQPVVAETPGQSASMPAPAMPTPVTTMTPSTSSNLSPDYNGSGTGTLSVQPVTATPLSSGH